MFEKQEVECIDDFFFQKIQGWSVFSVLWPQSSCVGVHNPFIEIGQDVMQIYFWTWRPANRWLLQGFSGTKARARSVGSLS